MTNVDARRTLAPDAARAFMGDLVRSEYLYAADPDDLRAKRAVRVDAAESVAPFEREQRPERSGRFGRAPDTGVVAQPLAESGIVGPCRIEEAVDPHQFRHAPRQ